MRGMKRWKLRSAVIIGLGMLGMLALAMRPALVPDSVVCDTDQPLGLVLRPAYQEDQAAMQAEYTWDFKDSPTGTVFLHRDGVDAFAALTGNPAWKITITAADGVAKLDSTLPEMKVDSRLCQVNAHFYLDQDSVSLLDTPAGSLHVQRHLLLCCELRITPSFWGKELHSLAVQELVADFYDGAIDLVQPTLLPAAAEGMVRQDIISMRPSGLPERFCGTVCEREHTRLAYMLAAINSDVRARIMLPQLMAKAEDLADCAEFPEQKWPDCWGEASRTVQDNARRIIPLMQKFKDNHCYGSRELADFLNGPVFAKLFGEPFMDLSAEPEQESPAPAETEARP